MARIDAVEDYNDGVVRDTSMAAGQIATGTAVGAVVGFAGTKVSGSIGALVGYDVLLGAAIRSIEAIGTKHMTFEERFNHVFDPEKMVFDAALSFGVTSILKVGIPIFKRVFFAKHADDVVGAVAKHADDVGSVAAKQVDDMAQISASQAYEVPSIHPGKIAAESNEINYESILRALRQSGTTEGYTVAKLLKRRIVRLVFKDKHPRGYEGLYQFHTDYVLIYTSQCGSPTHAAGVTAHEVKHYLQKLSVKTYCKRHEFDAYKWEAAVDKTFPLRTDKAIWAHINSNLAYANIRN